MFSKEHIVDELRRVAGQMGRTPGKRVFEQETGIKESDWLTAVDLSHRRDGVQRVFLGLVSSAPFL